MTKVVEKAPEMKQKIITLLYENLEDLIQNPFGNYAVQHALDVIFFEITSLNFILILCFLELLNLIRYILMIVEKLLKKLSKRLFSTPTRSFLRM